MRLVAGDDQTLARLLREHDKMLRAGPPRSSWLGGLTPDFKDGDARTIIARHHFFAPGALRRVHCAAERCLFPRLAFRAGGGRRHLGRYRITGAGVEGVSGPGSRALSAHASLDAAPLCRGQRRRGLATADAEKRGPDRRNPDRCRVGDRCDRRHVWRRLHHARAGGHELPSTRRRTAAAAMDVLLAHGASIEARGAGGGANAGLMINSCLANGRPEAAEYLAGRGALLDIEGAAGIGRLDLVQAFFDPDGTLKPPATLTQLKDGFTWACEYGRTAVVEYLLDHGVDAGEVLSRPHKQTGLHWAAHEGHLETVRALLKRRPPLDVRDGSFDGTPLDWALHGWETRKTAAPARQEPYYEIVALLIAAGARVDPAWLSDERARADPRMFAALTRVER